MIFQSSHEGHLKFIVCFEDPVLCTGLQKETVALSCFLYFTAFGHETKPPISRVVVYLTFLKKEGHRSHLKVQVLIQGPYLILSIT